MDHPNKRQKVGDSTSSYKEEVLFNSDTLSKIISYLPSVDLLNLALTCKKFGISNEEGDKSLIEKSARIAVHELATEEELATLPYYEGKNALEEYHYLQLLRGPLTFDQLVGTQYVISEDKTCVRYIGNTAAMATAFSNNILRAGKHYASFEVEQYEGGFCVGVMRPGQANLNAIGTPLRQEFWQNFSPSIEYNNNIQCCLYYSSTGKCCISDWKGPADFNGTWDGMETMSSGDEMGLLLDLDEGTLSLYKNEVKLGVMKRGLAGPYCWAASMYKGGKAIIKRGTIPP